MLRIYPIASTSSGSWWCSDAEWIADVRLKVDEAIEASTHTPAIDGETFVNQMLEHLHQAKSAL